MATKGAKRMRLTGIIVECIGIGLVIGALVEGISNNPAMYLAVMGSCMIATGGFLFTKIRRKNGK